MSTAMQVLQTGLAKWQVRHKSTWGQSLLSPIALLVQPSKRVKLSALTAVMYNSIMIHYFWTFDVY